MARLDMGEADCFWAAFVCFMGRICFVHDAVGRPLEDVPIWL
jgi:hypothetical protein